MLTICLKVYTKYFFASKFAVSYMFMAHQDLLGRDKFTVLVCLQTVLKLKCLIST